MSRVIAVGHAALDRIYRIEAFPAAPTKVRALAHVESGGGMAANAATAAARLGASVELWSRVGDDAAGRRIIEQLSADGVGTAHVRAFPGCRSSTSAIIVDGEGERLIVGERDPGMPPDPAWLPLHRMEGARAVLGDLRWPEAVQATFTQARIIDVPTILDIDLGGGDWVGRLMELTDYAIFSGPGLDAFLADGSDLERLAAVMRMGARHAGVTRGRQGYSYIDRSVGAGHQRAFAVDVMDTTGAGDAFHGGFAWALAQRTLPVAECVRIAAAVAAMKCTALGARAGLPAHSDLLRFLASNAG